jgi:hypothetical protein
MKVPTRAATTMPPTDGMAIGCITSEPRPVAQKMGSRRHCQVAAHAASVMSFQESKASLRAARYERAEIR